MEFKYSKGEAVAKRLLYDSGIDDPSEVEIKEIILGRKAFYQEKPLKNKEAEIVSYGGRSTITINSEIEFESKKRFAAAHELGHYEMHRDLTVIVDSEADLLNWYKGGEQENEANDFAAELLMPSDVFYKECFRRVLNPSVIEQLSLKFKVSKTAAILRFVRRGNYPVCIVYCKDNKMKWWKSSEDFKYFLRFNRNLNPPTGSVAYEIFTKGKYYLKDDLKQDIWKSDWFELYPDEPDSRFYEYCIYSPTHNYSISILWED
jgi:Zn-dependent peptidase ImmA (M78 family)